MEYIDETKALKKRHSIIKCLFEYSLVVSQP